MKLRLKRKWCLTDLIWILLFILPIVDAVNGYAIHRLNIYGIGSTYHMILTLICFIYTVRHKIFSNIYLKVFWVCSFSIVSSLSLNVFMNERIQQISMDRIMKTLITLFFFYFFYTIQRQGLHNKRKYITMVYRQCLLVFGITIVADITGICNYAYTNSGRTGLYAGSNEPTIIFTILQVFLLWFITKRTKISDSILFLIGELCIVLTESKSGIAIAITLFLLYILLLNQKNLLSKKAKNIIIIVSVTTILIGIWYAFPLISNSFAARQKFLSKGWSSYGKFAYLSSGRTFRINKLIINPYLEYLATAPFIAFLKLFIGIGGLGAYGDILEMDYLDVFRYGGITWLVGISILSYFVIKNSITNLESKQIFWGLIIVFIASFVVGHVWNGGNSGIYFSMLCIFTAHNKDFRFYNTLTRKT